MDEFDPASRDAPPARHLVESDSEDDESSGQGLSGRTSTAQPFKPPRVELENVGARSSQVKAGAPLVLLVGAVGEAYVRARAVQDAQQSWTSSVAVMVDGVQQGAVYISDDGAGPFMALIRPDLNFMARQQHYAYLGSGLFQHLQPSSVIIVDACNVSLYLADEAVRQREEHDSPIRCLHGRAQALTNLNGSAEDSPQPFASPNYLVGLSAALLCEASARDLPVTALLLPQEQSDAANPHLHATLPSSGREAGSNEMSSLARSSRSETQPDTLAPHLASRLARLLPFARSEPTSRPDCPRLDAFLHARRAAARKSASSEISAMYM